VPVLQIKLKLTPTHPNQPEPIQTNPNNRQPEYNPPVAAPAQIAEAEMIRELSRLLDSERVLSGAAARRVYDCDAYSVERFPPTVVTLPSSTEEVQAIVRWCLANGVPFTPRGAGTGLSGGSLPALGGVLISTKKMTRILEIDVPNRQLKAQAGAVNLNLSKAVAADGLHFAPDPSSQTVSTLGGNIAENSGGPHTLKYGVTTQHVFQVTMIDPAGEIVEIGSRVAGGPGYDLLGLIVGGEGTLGVVTEAWVKLTPIPAAVSTALAAFPEVRGATQSVADIIASGTVPAALEIMDRGILRALQAAFGLEYPAGTDALLLIECDAAADLGDAGERVAEEIESVRRICMENGALGVQIAQDEAERAKLWLARKKGIGAMGRLAPSIVTHDGVIPRSKLPEMLDFVYEVAERHGVGVANLFHAGDGNLHPCFYFDDRDPAQIERVVEAGEEIMKRCIELGGSITGEHGIGVEKLDLMSLMFSPDDLRLQEMAKSIFNTQPLCNPCKILPDQKSCVEHRKRWRGVAW
jgi:glycolate oxidase subunit GlcD